MSSENLKNTVLPSQPLPVIGPVLPGAVFAVHPDWLAASLRRFKFGAVGLLVNNAGVSAESTVLESSLDDWNWIMGGDFYGMLYGVRAFVPRMIEQDTVGHVVNIASMAGVEMHIMYQSRLLLPSLSHCIMI